VKKAVKDFHSRDRAVTRTLLPLVAIGGGLAVTPAAALELGELTVQSNLGQPLRASIAYALAPNEMLTNTCVSIGGGSSTSGLPGIGGSSVRITESAILISGETRVREPMLGTRVTINCPYTPNLSREYMLFVDPADPAAASLPSDPVATSPVAQPVAKPVARPAPTIDTTPINQSARYQVQPGDTLGDIASRIENRSVKLWPAVNAIFDANPDAFIDNDPNKLKAGSWLTIPSFDGAAPVVSAEADAPAVSAGIETASTVETVGGAVYEPPVLEDIVEPAQVADPVSETASELRPGDVILGSENPLVEPVAATTVVIPDTELPGPETTSATPNVPTANVSTTIVSTGSRSESTSLYTWLIGGGLAIFAALVLFGRRIRDRFGSAPIAAGAAVATPTREDAETVEEPATYDIDDDSPTEENLILDADLVLGTGLEEGTDMEVAKDFGFAATTALDIELPFEPEAPTADGETDVIPPLSPANLESILESEVLPEDDDYDMSVIVDATKMPQPEDVTERDLLAVPVGVSDETLISDNYTISKEVDYDILEQDYQEELSATQALNLEISRAAAEISSNLDGTVGDDETSAMPLASVTEIDVTAQLRAQNDETAEIEQSLDPNDTAAVTVNLPTDDETAEMPVANDDETAEMEIEGGKIDTSNR
jgi:FimV-like protein